MKPVQTDQEISLLLCDYLRWVKLQFIKDEIEIEQDSDTDGSIVEDSKESGKSEEEKDREEEVHSILANSALLEEIQKDLKIVFFSKPDKKDYKLLGENHVHSFVLVFTRLSCS